MRYEKHGAVVTGAASGIGQAIARAYLEEGARVALVDVRPQALDDAVAALPAPLAGRATPLVADVRDGASVSRVLDAAFAAVDPDILVNAAGVYPSHPFLEMREADWDAVLDTNLKGPYLVGQGFARRLVGAARPGNIVNVTSGAATRARPGAAHYTASKAALNMLTQNMALELAASAIRVNAVSPGLIEVHSEMSPLSDAYMTALVQGIPLGRVGRPEDVARVVLFATSDEAAWMTGSVLSIDGGAGAGNVRIPLSGPNSRYFAT